MDENFLQLLLDSCMRSYSASESIPSPTPSTPSPRANEAMSQGTPACPSSYALTSASKRRRGRTRGSVWRRVLGPFQVRKLSVHIPKEECRGVSSTSATLSMKIGILVQGLIPIPINKWADVPTEVKEYIMDRVLDHFDLDYTHQEDVRMVIEMIMMARRMHYNRMHAYFKKFLVKRRHC
ncbi:hypothetical protein CJ030_MR4G013733 [Morella rubra]|uniref:Uncharacterized protein n=1 Tax=Morella rubra TaxID=262757 RepID=A0A6A1WT47_9ROSI|nr:hypothetical protein CJ030_MR4G013733 [Morella rubra]